MVKPAKFNPNKPSTVTYTYLPKNENIVDRSGYVPTQVQVERIFSASTIADVYRRIKNPNGSENQIVDDLTALEDNYKDNLQMLATVKGLRMSLENRIEQARVRAASEAEAASKSVESSTVTDNVTLDSSDKPIA